MSVENELAADLRCRIAQLRDAVPGTIGDLFCFELLSADADACRLRCQTEPWMRNFAGTLHGGMGAAILDQAMGFLSYCLKPGAGTAPTVQLSVGYHRPLIPGEDVLVDVRLVSATRSLMTLSAEARRVSQPDKLCLSATGIYFFKPEQG